MSQKRSQPLRQEWVGEWTTKLKTMANKRELLDTTALTSGTLRDPEDHYDQEEILEITDIEQGDNSLTLRGVVRSIAKLR